MTVLVDVDPMSHSDLPDASVSDAALCLDLDRVASAAARLGSISQSWFCCSSLTARTHMGVLTACKNNTWRIGYGVDGADRIIEQALSDVLTSSSAKTPDPRAVVLVAGDGAYSGPIEALREAGVPTWLIIPPHTGSSAALRRAATAVTWMHDVPIGVNAA